MYIETSSNKNGDNVFCSFEGTDIKQISNITFFCNSFSSSDVNLRAMGRFRIQIFLEDNIWSTQYNICKNDQYSVTSTEWTLVNSNFTVENYGIELMHDEIDSAHADMCFSNITISHSAY